MTACKVIGLACSCQPDEGVECPWGDRAYVVEAFHGWRNEAIAAGAKVREQDALLRQALEALEKARERLIGEAPYFAAEEIAAIRKHLGGKP